MIAVGDTIEEMKLMGDRLDAAFEVNKLTKYSPKRERAFNRLREETAPGNWLQNLMPNLLDCQSGIITKYLR